MRRLYLRQGSLWCAKVPSNCSWSWRKILQLRDRIRPCIKHKVGNGTETFLWHDFWNPVGPLLPYYGERIIYDSAIHSNAHVAEVIGDGRWNWPIANSADLIAIKNSCVDYHLDVSTEDIFSWTLDPFGEFTVSSAWNHFRPKMSVVNWHHTIWFPQAIRRHDFIVWLPSRTDWLLRTSFSSGVSPSLCPVYFAGLVLKTGTTCFSVANSLLVFD